LSIPFMLPSRSSGALGDRRAKRGRSAVLFRRVRCPTFVVAPVDVRFAFRQPPGRPDRTCLKSVRVGVYRLTLREWALRGVELAPVGLVMWSRTDHKWGLHRRIPSPLPLCSPFKFSTAAWRTATAGPEDLTIRRIKLRGWFEGPAARLRRTRRQMF